MSELQTRTASTLVLPASAATNGRHAPPALHLCLVVSMSPRRAQLLVRAAHEENWATIVCNTAADALRQSVRQRMGLALVDLQLARGSTGFSVAVRLGDYDVPCLFVSGKAPGFPMPDLALGCLMKPFTAEDVHRSLAMAEDLMRGNRFTWHGKAQRLRLDPSELPFGIWRVRPEGDL